MDKKRYEVSNDNLKAIKGHKDFEITCWKLDLENAEAQNKLFPPNMQDDTKSRTYELQQNKMK